MNWFRQLHNGAVLMARFDAFARSIGCTVRGDAIEVDTPEQSAALDAWWKENTCESD
jgi:hypothetical protein